MRSPITVTILFALLIVLALIVPIPDGVREIDSGGKVLHALLFAMLAVFVFGIVRDRGSLPRVLTMFLCWGGVAGLGLATEVIQPFFGRDASWQDVWTDAYGSCAGILWAQGWATASRGIRIGTFTAGGIVFLVAVAEPLTVLADAAMQRIEMPRLASFESPLELSRWEWSGCHVERSGEYATHGSWAMRVDLKPGRYPGVTLAHPVHDWSRFDELVIDVHLAGELSLDLIVKIKDRENDNSYYDRFHKAIRLLPGENRIRIALSEVVQAPREREMDLRQITSLSLFVVSLDSPRTLFLDNLCLQ